MPLGNVYSVKVWQRVKAEHFVTRLHYIETQTCFAPRPAERLALIFRDVIVASIKAAVSQDWECTWLDTGRVTGTPIPRDQEIVALFGDIPSESSPLNSPVVFNLNTGVDIPLAQGRFYLSGVPKVFVNAGVVGGGWLTVVEPLRVNLTEPLTSLLAGGGQWKLCLYSVGLEVGRVVKVVAIRPNLGSMKTRRRRPETW